MRYAFTLLVLLPCLAWAEGEEVQLVQHGTAMTLRDSDVVEKLVSVVESASVESTSYANPAAQWERALAAPVYVRARFAADRTMQVERPDQMGREAIPVSEVLFVISESGWPDHLLLKTTNGYRAVTKYRPCPLAQLILALPPTHASTVFSDLRDGYCARYPDG